MKAATYLRQSLKKDEGIERQRDRTRKLIEARGWSFAGEYVDNDTTASKPRGLELRGRGCSLTLRAGRCR